MKAFIRAGKGIGRLPPAAVDLECQAGAMRAVAIASPAPQYVIVCLYHPRYGRRSSLLVREGLPTVAPRLRAGLPAPIAGAAGAGGPSARSGSLEADSLSADWTPTDGVSGSRPNIDLNTTADHTAEIGMGGATIRHLGKIAITSWPRLTPPPGQRTLRILYA
jgi:hypothetical protein